MGQNESIPLVGRLAIQLKMLTSDEVRRAMAESASSGSPKLAQAFLTMDLLDRGQIAKLLQVQKDLVEKARAKKRAADSAGQPQSPKAPQAAPKAVARPDSAARAGQQDEGLHAAAAHAAHAAAPMTSRDVAALHEAPTEVVEASQPPAASVDPGDFQIGPEPVAAVTPVEEAPPAPAAPASSPSASPRPPAPDPEDGFSLELPVPNPDSPDRERLESILSKGVNEKASDIHLHAGGPLKQRVNGELIVTEQQIESAEVERMVAAALTPEQRQVLGHDGEIDFCIDLPGIGRFRANAYRQQRGLDVVFRTVRETPPTFEELGLPDDLKKYTDYHQGMVLITGPAGCGKSSTLAALVNHINENRDDHILTVEDPIEIIHPSKRCLVNQRHAGHHTASFSRALRGALREDPDIIVIGELRDLETISLAMTAAETGHFVLATLHTANAVRTVNRMIGAFPSNEQDQVRAMLSESLRAVVSQRLVPAADGQGRVPALELLVINRAIGNLIRDEKTVQIRSSMQTGKAHGMYLLEQSLNELVAAGNITREVALSLAEEEKLITAGA